ncbi:MAG: T9SS type A sorting domain-containing protein [Flavobacteriales bacterium]|nr:T9SS type A sorting domain-containing protein [Flavobacteriales bacterium]
MRYRIHFSLSIAAAIALNTASALPGSWTQKNDVGFHQPNGPLSRMGAVSFVVGSKAYVGFGQGPASPYFDDLWEFDPGTNSWAQKASLTGGGRYLGVAFAIGTKGYVGTGWLNGPPLWGQDFWEYDPGSNTWAAKATFPGAGRNGAVGFAIGTKGYIGTGTTSVSEVADMWEYDPNTDAWTAKAAHGGGTRSSSYVFVVGGNAYIGAGNYAGFGLQTDLWCFDPVADSWTAKAGAPMVARYGASGFAIGSTGYVVNGSDGSNYFGDLFAYDTVLDAWTPKAAVPIGGRVFAVAFAVGGYGYTGTGGTSFPAFTDVWRYDPGANSWTARTGLGGTDRFGAIYFAIGGKGYIGMGLVNGGVQTDLWEFDPGTGTWSQKADFPSTGRFHAICFAIGNNGYVGSGYPNYPNDFWAYNATLNTWSAKAPFGGGGRGTAVGVSAGGKGYAGLGVDGAFLRPVDIWEYDPVLDAWSPKANFGGSGRWCPTAIGIGSKAYFGLGTDAANTYMTDWWEYDPGLDTWTQKANYPGTGQFLNVGFSIGAIGYVGTGNDGLVVGSDLWAFAPGNNTWTQQANVPGQSRFGAAAFGIGGKGYLGTGFLHDLYEFDPLGVSCTENLTLELKTDASPAQTTWEIVPQGGGTPYCTGGGYAANTMVYEPCCLPIGYHELRVYDSLGDGIAPGGYRLKNAAGERIIDNWGDGQDFTFTSAAPLAFHVPIGTDKLIVGSCDKETWTANEFIIASPNAGVSAQWGIGNQTDDGYQFWFLNPDGGYSRRIFRDHATSGGFGPANAVRACHLKISSMVTLPVPYDVLLNVRVRSRVNGTYAEFGPACRFRMPSNQPCPPTQLVNNPNSPSYSCGVTRVFNGSDKVHANPVSGANKYRFRFDKVGGGFTRTIASTSITLLLSWVTQPLVDGDTYDVTVQASFDGGTTYCPYGPSCQVTIDNTPAAAPRSMEAAGPSTFRIHPNPNQGDLLYLMGDALGELATTVSVDFLDLHGRRVMQVVLPAQAGALSRSIALDGALANGVYFVHITSGENTTMERLVIER